MVVGISLFHSLLKRPISLIFIIGKMSKRFTETDIWAEDWFVNLSDSEILFWFYIKDQCDQAGFWRPNFKNFELITGRRINQVDFLTKVNTGKERIQVLKNGRWFITGFILFQYGCRLNLKNAYHKLIYDLFRANLINANTTSYGFEVSALPVKEIKISSNIIELPKARLLDKDRFKIPPTIEMVQEYCNVRQNGIDPYVFYDYYNVRNWTPKGMTRQMTDWQAAVRLWERWNATRKNSQESQEDLFDRLEREGKIPNRKQYEY